MRAHRDRNRESAAGQGAGMGLAFGALLRRGDCDVLGDRTNERFLVIAVIGGRGD